MTTPGFGGSKHVGGGIREAGALWLTKYLQQAGGYTEVGPVWAIRQKAGPLEQLR